MSIVPLWRALRARFIRVYPYILLAVSLLMVAATPFVSERLYPMLTTLPIMVSTLGIIVLANRWQLRHILYGDQEILERTKTLAEKLEESSDNQMMMIAAAVGEGLRAHVEPDSPWRLRLIKEIADHINDENEMTLAAIEGTVADLVKKLNRLQLDLDQIRGGK